MIVEKIVVIGCGIIGKIAKASLEKDQINIFAFFDSNKKKQGGFFQNTKILTEEELDNLDKNTLFIIAHNYFNSSKLFLNKKNFHNVDDCIKIFNKINLDDLEIQFNEYESQNFKREIDWYTADTKKERSTDESFLQLKCIDIMITEKCSMKCKDCANLMQYYIKPENADIEILFKSIDRLMSAIEHLYEFRVLGGEPFMNKDINKVINKLKTYKNFSNIVIYTNATIIPKNENLTCLQSEKVTLEITNYGESLSKNHDKIVEIYKQKNINYRTKDPGEWTESGKIKFYKRSKEELQRTFDNCCVKNTTTLMDGVLYRCPYAANATKLKAVPLVNEEVVHLKENKSIQETKKEINKFFNSNKPITACSFCGGRDYNTEKIKAAIQADTNLPYAIHSEYKNGLKIDKTN